jgi:hypothetical protein
MKTSSSTLLNQYIYIHFQQKNNNNKNNKIKPKHHDPVFVNTHHEMFE